MSSPPGQEQEDLLSSRPPVTQHEAEVIHSIVRTLKESEKLYLSGTLDLAGLGVDHPALLYTINDPNGGIQAAKAISLNNPSSNALQGLHADCDPSPFGHGKETIYDESYRFARELQFHRLGFNFDPTSTSSGVLAAVSAFITPTAGGDSKETPFPVTGVEAKLYKLNVYTTGGHFKRHLDTPKAKNHIGTLLFGIPTPFEGGELILTHGSISEADGSPREPRTATVDWSKVHEILPVKSGYRLTIAYDIFATETVRYRVPADPNKIKACSNNLYEKLREALSDEEFLSKGGRLAFALNYQYPAKEMEHLMDGAIDIILKGDFVFSITDGYANEPGLSPSIGNDYLLLHTLKSLSLRSEIQAVYEVEELPKSQYEAQIEALAESSKTAYPVDRFSSLGVSRDTQPSGPDVDGPFLNSGSALLTAFTFGGIHEDYYEEHSWEHANFIIESTDASVDWVLIWARRPTRTAWAVASTYVRHGNMAETAYSYVAGVLIVDVPVFGEGVRKVTK
ncbi:hypothetical protein M407DRAFT_28023 [Tulasnella calospora MUT 4182]|uniref:Fe2OG dioxygenase domain-containing protein n=1 Tax=Tulasnella calospora MUT 4182 TaxID=1051891 RepID=A0A0C3QBG2_9AGAM|nr:hypothetical protein M407DRAFT_28023 [Tulasnella calospora MUT 4182]